MKARFLPSFDGHPLAAEIQWERHNLFMEEVGSRMVGSVIVACIVGLMFYRSASSTNLVIWFSGVTFVALNSWFLIRRYFQMKRRSIPINNLGHLRRWHWINLYLSVIWGLFWSLTPALFFPDASQIQILSLLLLVVVASSMPSVTMGCYPDIYVTFLTPVFWSFSWQLLSVDFGGEILPLVIAPLTWCLLVAFSVIIHRTHMEAIVLRLEHRHAEKMADQRNEAKTRFIAVASHDLRQPVQAARLYAESMLANRDQRDDETTGKLVRSLTSASELLDRLLDISKMDAGVINVMPEVFDIFPVLDQLAAVHTVHADEKNIDLKLINQHLFTRADQSMVMEILDNIVANAIRYTDAGQVLIAVEKHPTELTVTIADTGRGIPSDLLQDVFEEFVQVGKQDQESAQGMGLGLPIVRRLCQLNGLTYELSSEDGKGTVFTLHLPKIDKTLTPVRSGPVEKSMSPCRILLVDDEEQITDALSTILVADGHDVWVCHTQKDVEKLLESDRFAPDILVTDDRLTDGLQSDDVIRLVTSHYPEIPTLVITGNTSSERIRELELSGRSVLFKPVGREQIKQHLERLLR